MKKMTPKERIQAALRFREVDRVPVAPDVAIQTPIAYTRKPFWKVLVEEKPPLWELQLDLAEKFGFDLILHTTLVDIFQKWPEDPEEKIRVISKQKDAWKVEKVIRTPKGELNTISIYPKDKSPWVVKPLITDPEKEINILLSTLTDPTNKELSKSFISWKEEVVGQRAALCHRMEVPLSWWLYQRSRLDRGILDFFDRTSLIERAFEIYEEWALKMVRVICEKEKPDILMFGGAVSSMSVVSPELYAKYAYPFLCRATKIADEYGTPIAIHMCGKCKAALDMLVDAGIDMVEPLEAPSSGGDVHLKEVREKYGEKLCLKGNVNTSETLVRGTPEKTFQEAKQCIQDAGKYGFILSSGDQVSSNTPKENFRALIAAAKE